MKEFVQQELLNCKNLMNHRKTVFLIFFSQLIYTSFFFVFEGSSC